MAKPCSRCRQGTIEFQYGEAVRKIGHYSLSGKQMKASITTCLIATCTNCDLSVAGHPEDFVYDEATNTFVHGRFVEDRTLIALIHKDKTDDQRPEGTPGAGEDPHV